MKTIQVRNIGFVETPRFSNTDWQNEQAEDLDIGPVLELVKGSCHLQYTCKEGDSSGMCVLLKYKQYLLIKNGLLYRKAKLKNHNSVVNQFVLPKPFRRRATLALQNRLH